MNYSDFLLSLLIWVPIAGGGLVLAAGEQRLTAGRWIALATAIATFLLSVPLYSQFDSGTAAMQFTEFQPWIAAINVNYHVGVDGISMPLILLTTFMTVLVIVAGWEGIKSHVSQYFAAFLIMEGLMIGVFSALDAILFYVFWESMLIPMFVIIGLWGGPNRVYATIKFFLYTFLGSVLMLVAFIYLYYQADRSFDIATFHQVQLGMNAQILIFFALFAAFAVKIPMWPVHTWLPTPILKPPPAVPSFLPRSC